MELPKAQNLRAHLVIAAGLRLVLLGYSVYQDRNFKVKFTDVDYHVFNEAAERVLDGQSPYDRHTYRYSPILAFLLAPGHLLGISAYFGKLLFILCDLICGWLIFELTETTRSGNNWTYLLWLYNPITLAVSVRGNAESFVILPTLAAIYLRQKASKSRCLPLLDIYSATCIATAIHLKIYPVIYALTFWFSFQKTFGLFSKRVILYATTAAVVLASWNVLFYWLYRDDYLEHALLYHFKRSDIRHNFSIWFVPMYLAESKPSLLKILSLSGFVAQAGVVTILSVKLKENSIGFATFLQTLAFVSYNKVCTSQYFLWYLALLPLAVNETTLSPKKLTLLFILWLCGQGGWLFFAYQLEFKRQPAFQYLFLASMTFLLINTFVICSFISYRKKNIPPRTKKVD